MSEIKNCTKGKDCVPHEFQDRVYGKNKRIFNRLGKDKKDQLRCTVCGEVLKPSMLKK